jgi:hypothetical protein
LPVLSFLTRQTGLLKAGLIPSSKKIWIQNRNITNLADSPAGLNTGLRTSLVVKLQSYYLTILSIILIVPYPAKIMQRQP